MDQTRLVLSTAQTEARKALDQHGRYTPGIPLVRKNDQKIVGYTDGSILARPRIRLTQPVLINLVMKADQQRITVLSR